MWLTAAVAFCVAVLSGLGVGGAGLFVTYLVFARKTPQLAAQGLNLLFFLFSSASALAVHIFRTPLLYKCLLFLIPFGLVGSFCGAYLAVLLPQALLRRLFGVLLILSGALALFSRKKE